MSGEARRLLQAVQVVALVPSFIVTRKAVSDPGELDRCVGKGLMRSSNICWRAPSASAARRMPTSATKPGGA
jgi:hypothetical protein